MSAFGVHHIYLVFPMPELLPDITAARTGSLLKGYHRLRPQMDIDYVSYFLIVIESCLPQEEGPMGKESSLHPLTPNPALWQVLPVR